MITIHELLFNWGFDKKAKIKLVRHKDSKRDLYTMHKHQRPEFFNYQKSQSKDFFNGVDYIISFIGEEGKFARFIGVYKVSFMKKATGTRWQK